MKRKLSGNELSILDKERIERAIENTSEEAIKFLYESNLIECEESIEALEDSVVAWNYANTNICGEIGSDYVKNMHFLLMRRLNPKIAGKFRTLYCMVGEKMDTAHPKDIDMLMREWCEEFNATKKFEEKIKKEHIKFMKIHPFEDGNGRTGRILMNTQRLNSGYGLHLIVRSDSPCGDNYMDWFK